jgi:hypothetical protein
LVGEIFVDAQGAVLEKNHQGISIKPKSVEHEDEDD